MKNTELRIGNWVEIKDQEVKTYAQIEGVGNLQHVAGQLYPIEELEPIPLTEEWLERFGFNFDVNSGLYKKSGFEVEVFNIGVEFYLGEYGSWFLFVEHVHQLQNLYFALTGEELELKEVEQ